MTYPCAEDSPAVRIVADDLSGALDAAGPFAASNGAVGVYWDARAAVAHAGERVALDTGSRELPADQAIARTRSAAEAMWSRFQGLAFLKVDSVWRGSPAATIAAAAREGGFGRVVVAPAFPEQGRLTRGGGQWVVEGGDARCVAADIASELRAHGVDAATQAQASPATRAWVCDAESAADLAAIVERQGRSGVRTLWCGTRGLARALAARATQGQGAASAAAVAPAALEGPVLFVVGTDHPVSVAQASALEREPGIACRTIGAADAGEGAERADAATAVLLRFAIADGTPRDVARHLIAQALRREVGRMRAPGAVVATGGETVRALGDALGATRLDVHAEYEPGIPRAVWGDGRWAGTPILSKSGGFGAPDLFARLAASAARDTRCTRNAR